MIQGLPAGEPLTAAEIGRVCAVAGQIQREMRSEAEARPALFADKAFDPALFSTLSLALAFSAPELSAADLRLTHRMTLWSFALDWLVDYAAASAEEVAAISERCLSVASGGRASDDLTSLLAEIRDDLATAPAFPALRDVWRDELERVLRAMTLEWQWKATAQPSFDDYLANSANLGFAFVFTTHWIWTGDSRSVGEVRAASWSVERVIRLLNDLATYERDLSWGDLNALLLDVSREQVERKIRQLAEESWTLIDPLRATQPELAEYMVRQVQFCAGFYRITDYWGAH
ncbi:terpene synthase family protein [Nonomuraea lactucae]|uniref:terpene synthase family protein n=1 Tax=Nonomuraea lactucae TaxID=2249762 RepID=UPI000DE30352|nr:hypothetical protein [Nonomuraea lactucae]